MVIKESKVKLSIYKKCEVLSVKRSSYYKWLKSYAKDKSNKINKDKIIELYHKHKGTYGKNRIVISLRNSGLNVNHKKVYRIMKKYGLKAVIRKKWSIRKYVKHNVYNN